MARAKPRDHHGREYSTVKEMCRHYGVSVSAYYEALDNGATTAEALEPGRRKYYKYNGHLFIHREGLLAYAGVTRFSDIADHVTIVTK